MLLCSRYPVPGPVAMPPFISTPAAAQTVVQAFILCRLDHCNSLLYGISENLMRRVQSVQNAAARLLTGARRRDHISPVLCRLHWFLVRRRIDFKLACLVHLSLAGQTPHYLDEDIHLVAAGPGRQLRSSTDRSRSASHARTARPATEALPQQGLVCGTVCHRIYATKNSVFGASGAC